MANVKISDMTPGVALDGTELLEMVQSSATASTTTEAIRTLTKSNSYTHNAPITGFTLTIGAGVQYLVLEPAGTLATGTVTMPTSPVPDGTVVCISSTQIITALTIAPGAGQTVSGSATTLAASVAIAYLYRLSNTTWYRVG